jgi:hypothetical protein
MTPVEAGASDGPPGWRRSLGTRPLHDLWFAALGFARVYRRLVLLTRPLSVSPPEVAAPSSIRIAVLAPEEIDAYLAFRPDQSGALIRARFSGGYVCFAVWHDQHIVHAAWGATERARIDYLSREIELGPDEVFIFDAFTAPASRGRNLSPVRALVMGRHYADRGYRRVLTAVHPENRAGFRPLEKVGTRPVGVIGYIGIGPLRWHFCRRRE